ncbi:MAG TPA: hypothetical protein PKV67_03725 [Hyphomonas sp.]|nr:hypothetical protein [Hyphomonas sp.]HRI99859.1 hypothetical protein [Hyphomonas sp.]HRK67040.1 hypothetical protein [Hyphomonas sp.]
MIRRSAFMALGFGVFLAIAEIVRNWGDWQPWPFWIVDFIAAGALIWGGVRTLSQGSSRLLSAAWGFTVGIFWMSFFSHAQNLDAEVQETYAGGSVNEGVLTLIIGAMLVFAIAGLIMSLTRRTI